MIRVVIEKFQPFLGGVIRRQNFPFSVFILSGGQKITHGQACSGTLDGPFNRPFFRPLDDGGQNRATEQVALIQGDSFTVPKADP